MANIAIVGAGQRKPSWGFLAAAHHVPSVAAALIDGLYDPRALFPWFVDPAFTRESLLSKGVPPALLEQLWNPPPGV